MAVIPVVLFAYNRPDLLSQTLACLKENHVPLLYIFSDAAKSPDKQDAVDNVRQIIHAIDWCEINIVERQENYGLGRSILAGVSSVFEQHDAAIVFEDDLVCVPGTYEYLRRALEHYANNPKVMSVTGWTHPRVIPTDVSQLPYFDGRSECLVWGTWRRAWQGMTRDAIEWMQTAEKNGLDIYRYGADLPFQAQGEKVRNIWAVRFLYMQIAQHGLCLRPPHSMVEHMGIGADATNSMGADELRNPPLQPCPPIPQHWPEAIENAQCPQLWQQWYGSKPSLLRRVLRSGKKIAPGLAQQVQRLVQK